MVNIFRFLKYFKIFKLKCFLIRSDNVQKLKMFKYSLQSSIKILKLANLIIGLCLIMYDNFS